MTVTVVRSHRSLQLGGSGGGFLLPGRSVLRALVALVAALALCAALPAAAHAQEAARPAASTSSALVEDQYGEVMTVEDPSFNKPASGFSLGGGGKGNKLKELHVWKGAHEIIVPLDKITRIDIGKAVDGDLVEVKLTLAGGAKLEGKVDRDLELHGRVQFGRYQIKFERMKSIQIRA